MKTSARISAVMSGVFVVVLTVLPASAEERSGPIAASAARAAASAAAEAQADHPRRGSTFWSGVALGATGVTMSVLAVTAARIDNTSTGNAPAGAYNACVALKNSDPVYATNNCGGLKGKNNSLLWSGVAVGAAGAALIVRSAHTSAELTPGGVRLFHTLRF